MYFRHERLFKTESLTAGKEWSDDLPSGGLLDHLLITFRIQNASAHYDRPEPHIHDHVTNIALKDGGKNPFIDAWGQSVLYNAAVGMGHTPKGVIDVMSSNYQTLTFPVLLGRRPFDGKYGLDLGRLESPKIYVDNDWTSDDYTTMATMDIDAWFLEEPPVSVTKCMRLVEWDSITFNANSQTKKVKVPNTERIRQIILGCESARTSATGGPSAKAHKNLRYLKYTYNTGGKVVKDDDLFRNDQDALWGFPDRFTTELLGEARASYYMDSMLCRPIGVSVCPAYSAAGTAQTEIKVDQRVERFLALRAVTVAGEQLRGVFTGYGYLDHLRLKEFLNDNEDEYLDPKARADVEIEVGNHTSGGQGTIRFVAQSLAAVS